jgi:hypothetical protein
VVEDACTPAQVAQLSDALDAAYERTKGDKRTGGGAPDPNAKDHFIHNVLEEDPAFAFLLDNPPVLLRMRAILGSAVQLHSATARYVSPGMKDQQWHRDGGFPVAAPGDSDYRFGQINCGYFLDELTPELGVSSYTQILSQLLSLFSPHTKRTKAYRMLLCLRCVDWCCLLA